MPKVSVVIAAAGKASRMQGIEKQWMQLGTDPVVMHSILTFSQINDIIEIIVVVKKNDCSRMKSLLEEYSISIPMIVVAGGESRQQSAEYGYIACNPETEYIAVHDGARPFVTKEDMEQVLQEAYRSQAASLGVRVKETIKIVDEQNQVISTPQRDRLFSTQTPQVFDRSLYHKGITYAKQTGQDFTDDCQLMEAMGVPVKMVAGSYQNIKITTPEDVALANALYCQNKEEVK